MKKWPETETELARAVINWLQNGGMSARVELTPVGWDVYQEVDIGGESADIVAVRDGIVWIIETKLTMCLTLLEQGFRWLPHAHFVSVAIPRPKRGHYTFARRIASTFGIGILQADQGDYCRETIRPAFRRRVSAKNVIDRLRPEHKTFAEAGSPTGRRWTPWKETCVKVEQIARATPGIDLRELIKSMKHHYASNASAYGSLKKWIEKNKVEGVRCERDGKKIRIFPGEGTT